MKTPLTSIRGYTELIRSHTIQDSNQIDTCLDCVLKESDHMTQLINDILTISKLETEEMQVTYSHIQVKKLLDSIIETLRVQIEKMDLKVYVNATEFTVFASMDHIKGIFYNVVSNAIKYNKRGGRIDTYVKELSFDGMCAAFEFRITDTGVGMSKEYIKEELFKPFTQEINDARTQYRGTGLGMSIVKGLVEKMGGTIQVSSTPGVGTEFRFYLSFPVVQPEKESQSGECVQGTKQDLKEDKPLRGYHILLAEDNEINMEIAEFYLEEAGAQVIKAWNGQEAVELFKQSGLREYDAVLMDIMMPEMDGKEASRKIRSMADKRADSAEIPILAMTAQASTESIHQCELAGMNECIFKPVNAKELIGLLQDIVEKI